MVPIYWNYIPHLREEFNILGTNINEKRDSKIKQGNPYWVPSKTESSGILYVPYNTSITVIVSGKSSPIYERKFNSVGELIGYDRCGLQLIDYIDRDNLYSSYIPNNTEGSISYSFNVNISTGYSLYLGHYDNIPIF